MIDDKSVKSRPVDVPTFAQFVECLELRYLKCVPYRPGGVPQRLEFQFSALMDGFTQVFRHKNLLPLLAFRGDYKGFVTTLGELSGIDMWVDNGEHPVRRIICALEELHQHGAVDKNPEVAKLRSLARLAEEIWEEGMIRKKFLSLLKLKAEVGERQLYRDFAKMRRLADFRHYRWLNVPKSVGKHQTVALKGCEKAAS